MISVQKIHNSRFPYNIQSMFYHSFLLSFSFYSAFEIKIYLAVFDETFSVLFP